MIFTSGRDNKEEFARRLTELGEKCDEACFVTAFFTRDENITLLSKAGKKVRLTVSLRPPTNPKALRRIALLGNVEVRFLGRELHSKIYGFSKGDRESFSGAEYDVLIGSSNMTHGGIYSNIETNVQLTGQQAELGFEEAEKIFEMSNPLITETLDRYEQDFDQYEMPHLKM